MMDDFDRLLKLVDESERTVLDPSWVEDELFAIKMTGAAKGMLKLLDSGKKYFNHDNSSVAYLIGITDYAPSGPAVTFRSGRVEPPDIDIDVQHDRREEVKRYLSDRWKYVSGISVYTKFTAKNLVRDISRALAIDMNDVNTVCRQFDEIDVFLRSDETRWFRNRYPEVVELVAMFNNRWRQSGLHAAGIVIGDVPLSDVAPIESRSQTGKESRTPCVAYDMSDCLKVGLIKFDILGLDTLSVLSDCLKVIHERHGIDLDLSEIPLDDKETLAAFDAGHTAGIFQAEAAPLTGLMRRLGVSSFDDIVLSNALVRPGALLTVADECINRKRGISDIPREHPLVEEITSDTYNLFVYQEQLIEALVKIGGFSWPEADRVRKIIGKKQDPELFKLYEDKWMKHASEILGQRPAKKLWADFEKFAGYAFNKAHATAYAMLMYRCMWLKVHFPLEYMFALLKNEENRHRSTIYQIECRRLGVPLLGPDINSSMESFSIDGDAIRFGLGNINGVGRTAVEEIISKRPFTSIEDFNERISKRRCNSRVTSALMDSGAFRSLGGPEGDAATLYQTLGIPQEVDLDSLPFSVSPLSAVVDDSAYICVLYVQDVKMFAERVRLTLADHIFLDSSPVTMYAEVSIPPKEGDVIIALIVNNRIVGYTELYDYLVRREIGSLTEFERVVLHGDIPHRELQDTLGTISDGKALVVPIAVRRFRTKKGDPMARVAITDGKTVIDTVVFPSLYKQVAAILQPFVPICVKLSTTRDGTVTYTDDGMISVETYRRLKGL